MIYILISVTCDLISIFKIDFKILVKFEPSSCGIRMNRICPHICSKSRIRICTSYDRIHGFFGRRIYIGCIVSSCCPLQIPKTGHRFLNACLKL